MRVHPSAYRHHLTEEGIRHAWNNSLGFYEIDLDHEPPKGLCIGPDTAANLLEILYLQFADGDLVIHAMPLRPQFRSLLTGDQT